MKKVILLLTFLVVGIIGWYLYSNHSTLEAKPHYVGQKSCAQCHQVQHKSHNNTLHPLIFFPVTSADQIVGDFEQNSPLVTFKKEEITHVVGTKWEQVYMRVIDGDHYPFTAKWMITTQKWVPYKVHNWKETPASTKCNGCHTTGYDSKTYEFNEYGVQCEACHGPASHHVAHQQMSHDTSCLLCHDEHEKFDEDIIVSQKSSVCGQCHSRGRTKTTDEAGKTTLFNFPLKYLPGQDINSSFKPTTPQTDKKNKNWWGNGISKNRHQEFADFSFSKHAKSLENLRNKPNPHGGEKMTTV
ncbi:MAG: multiheme c-type cytochrome [Campylobacterota bacterium]|nr:multiheme c-type cytochrome [Campylobacterota bacterium]